MDVLDNPTRSTWPDAGPLHRFGPLVACTAALALAACAQVNRAPVEDRTAMRSPVFAGPHIPPEPPARVAPPPPVVQGDGWRTVQPGDTLVRIGLETGNSWKDIARWNQIENPDVLAIGQVIRVQPPPGDIASDDPYGVEVSPVGNNTVQPIEPQSAPPPLAENQPAAPPPPPATSPSPPPGARVAHGSLAWPANGQVLRHFKASDAQPGLDIGGQAGDPVYAVADGKVIYAGADLPGYGNMIILQHNESYLSAYGHNRKLLVKDEQQVKKGQKIAEMGDSHTDRIKLHFELRHKGLSIDPRPFLGSRP